MERFEMEWTRIAQQRPQTPIWARDEELERSVSQKELWSPLRALRRKKQDEAGRETTHPLRTGAAVYELRAAERTEGTLGFWWCGRYGMHRWAMPIAPIDVDLAKYAHVTIVSPIWVFALAAPMRAFCGEAAGKIRTADYILVHHTRGQYENAAREMDALLGIHHTALRSVQCKVGRYRKIPTNSRCGGSDQRL